MDEGRTRTISSSDVSCSTMKAGTPCSLAVERRHSPKYSRKPKSSPLAGLDAGMAIARLLTGIGNADGAGADFNHFGIFPHTSQPPQEFHFGVSPKCMQICRCRHLGLSAKLRIT